MKRILIISSLCLFSFAILAQEQEVVASGGDDFRNSNGSLQWTVGEIVTESYSNDAGGLNQGFHHGSISVTKISENILNREISAFPNPAGRIVVIKFDKETCFEYVVYHMSGEAVLQGKEKQRMFNMPVDQLTSGIYFLKIIEDNQILKTFKIEKI